MLPEQVENEFRRNRESKIADALKRVEQQKFNVQLPHVCRQYPEYDQLRNSLQRAEALRSSLLAQLKADVASQKLKADGVITDLFAAAERLDVSDKVVAKARERMERGDPPGKKGSYGDALNWETLLAHAPSGEDLHLVAEDSDWVSPLDADRFDAYLAAEWLRRQQAEVHFYRRLSAFVKEQCPDIDLATEEEKDALVQELGGSRSFAQSRTILRKLSKFSDFTDAQLEGIAGAALGNNQVYWISGDADINRFVRSFISGHEDRMAPETLKQLRQLLGEK